MRLFGKNILMLVSTGVEEDEVVQIRHYFAQEEATVTITSAEPYMSVDTVDKGRRGCSVTIDIPLEDISPADFHGLVIPDSIVTEALLSKPNPALDVINDFYRSNRPIFASGRSVELLYESCVFPQRVLIRDGQSMQLFLEQAVGLILDKPISYPAHVTMPPAADR